MAFFSIIIPVFNKEKFIQKTIESVLNQTFHDFELLLINDGSTDTSEQQIHKIKDERIRYFSQENKGVARTRNFGIENAKSDYICFLDADDFWFPNFLEVMHSYIQKLPGKDVFSCSYEIETGKRTYPAHYSVNCTNNYQIVNYFEASQNGSIIWTSGVTIKKDVFDKVGAFDEKVKIGEDTDLWIRIGLEFPIVFICKTLARYVYDEKSISRSWHYIFEETSFLKYAEIEKTNPALKRFMDLNRFSAAIKSKLIGDKTAFRKLVSAISPNNLSLKRRILLQLPKFILILLIKIKHFLNNIGLGNSAFK